MAMSFKAASGAQVAGARRASTRPARLVAVGAVTLKDPPYPLDALEPYMSKQTLEFHWGKHHRAYVDNLNKQIAGGCNRLQHNVRGHEAHLHCLCLGTSSSSSHNKDTGFACAGKDWDKATLEEIVVASYANGSPTPEFNNAGQVCAAARAWFEAGASCIKCIIRFTRSLLCATGHWL